MTHIDQEDAGMHGVLRAQAEAEFAKIKQITFAPPHNSDELWRELRINQAELALQNLELRRIHTELEKTKNHYIDLYDFAPVGYLTLNEEGVILEVNLTAARLFHQDRHNIVGQCFSNFVTGDFNALWRKHFQLAKQTNCQYGCELPYSDESGALLYYHLDWMLCSSQQGQRNIRITLTDVTARKRAETELRIAAAAFNAQESILVADSNRVILRVNEAFTRMTGYSASEAIGNTPRLLRSGRHDRVFYDNIMETMVRDGYWEGEIWNKRKNGEIFPVLQTITAVVNEEGQLTHYVGTMIDISLQKRAEKMLQSETREVNTALSVLLKHREKDKADAQISLSNEIEMIIMPLLLKLKGLAGEQAQSLRLVNMLEDNLKSLMKSYGCAKHLDAAYQKLTPLERRVAAMVKSGKPTKVIAAMLNIAEGTVSIHRKHIRKKLGLDVKENLQGYLQSLTDVN